MKNVYKKFILSWINIIGISCCFACSVFMMLVFYSFIFYGEIVFYKPNLLLSVIEFIAGIIAFIYCVYLLIDKYIGGKL